jgi:hypothetical protein
MQTGDMTRNDNEAKPIVRTARQARQAERGPTVLNVLVISTVLSAIGLAITWWMLAPTP